MNKKDGSIPLSEDTSILFSPPHAAAESILISLIIGFFAVGHREYLTLSCHLIAGQILIVGGDLINQLSIHNLHNAVCRGLYDLMVT